MSDNLAVIIFFIVIFGLPYFLENTLPALMGHRERMAQIKKDKKDNNVNPGS